MDNRLTKLINQAKKTKRKLFVAYVTLGYPGLAVTEKAILTLEKAGADILELGIPFSDPLADGPTIQGASEYALRRDISIKDGVRLIEKLRKKNLKMPVVCFSYWNPILHFGGDQLFRKLKQNGFDGLIIPDLSIEEGQAIEEKAKANNLSLVYLVAPTTNPARMKKIAKRSNDFIYYVSLRGVTGVRNSVPTDLVENVKLLKRITKKPILVGFGVSEPEQAREICKTADGIIVGSAIVKELGKGESGIKRIESMARAIRKSIS
ncbi:MAG: tryptophan synthase subunit alpha [Omnitrophica bacterium RIFCSPLOWO2_12_FULL_44_17]|uniref:Tryptophan synthase alpha chain n=1 Tax=Candidatus Danuiimicrobium aquiferis TaxID=1801832 RepID=A0A1G1L2M0_9BACT|nr:MAG: tryptophan synthase subunit alpha [Omnitrophica bacterium RIFCSPHIGHO2_02_FULL_45_28]OGW88373.1 MAG: tryptophan synthase subunit alpha [Omnitrophica bacterium RIFCSPHIGHO2_12_FULL_44_12]OGW99391.1 MAG: tryptophan synthase subunit alpha [Omnitrophica bacterium RIFCSPLOWO2_12_FULL_44_17]OGX03424.1 MAG: tryptophan synthase subunit alpha [Omnitrophica bacterium RIFCSPLOWO2_02_FULL_44_11]